MKLIVGLGNPGKKYEKTRHNAGFMVVDKMAKSGWMKHRGGLFVYSWLGSEVLLVKPHTFMNKSGEAVVYLMKKHGLSRNDVVVVHDDLDIALGEYKFQQGKGPKVHNGINSVSKLIGGEDYWRLRVGVNSRTEEQKQIPGKEYVLKALSKLEAELLEEVMKKVVFALIEWCE